jgi:hypothetical protein
MGVLGFIFSLVAMFFLFIGVFPFLGWLNWFTTLPAAILGVIFSGRGLSRGRSGIAIAGLVIGIMVLVLAFGRLAIGCGIF